VGTAFLTTNQQRIWNYPDQHYSRGVAKNDATNRRFKAVARILKRIRYEMLDDGIALAEQVTSFELESLVWNVPDPYFVAEELRTAARNVIAYLRVNTAGDDACRGWSEVNGIKNLWRCGQPWNRQRAYEFLNAAARYAGLL